MTAIRPQPHQRPQGISLATIIAMSISTAILAQPSAHPASWKAWLIMFHTTLYGSLPYADSVARRRELFLLADIYIYTAQYFTQPAGTPGRSQATSELSLSILVARQQKAASRCRSKNCHGTAASKCRRASWTGRGRGEVVWIRSRKFDLSGSICSAQCFHCFC
jgi:hypothetical protein